MIATVGNYEFYQRKSGAAAATGYIKHTLTNIVIHRMKIDVKSGAKNTQYTTCTFDFECRAADETKGIADMWTLTDDQAAPTYMTAARGGIRILTTVHGSTDIYHVTGFTFEIVLKLLKACNDGDIGYTCVDVELDNGMAVTGSINFEDGSITATQLLGQTLVAAKADLVLTVRQAQGATSKAVTIANVDFDSFSDNSDATGDFDGYDLSYDVVNDASTPITLDGANKIIVIADV